MGCDTTARRGWRRVLAGATLLLAAVAPARPQGLPGAALAREFTVYLEDRRIGTHRFEVTAQGAAGMATVVSTAEFQVKILGLTAYRYRHRAVEQWRDGCLLELSARTDDNGHSSQVESRPQGPGCVMSYAYWDARLLGQQRLLNPQTGAYDRIQVQHLGSQVLKVRDTPLRAEHYALSSEQLKIELWYSPGGEWLQLDSTTKDGKRLRYRLN